MRLRLLFFMALQAGFIQAAPRAPLAPAERTNGIQTVAALDGIAPQAKDCVALIYNQKDRVMTTATWVAQDGYFLTKASDATMLEKARIRWGDKQTAAIRVIHRSVAHDLLLAQAVGVTGVKPVTFDNEPKKIAYGQWLAAPATGGKEVRIGVMSAQRRRIPGDGAAMGVRMDEKSSKGGGVRIVSIAEDSPAAAAGLRKDDVLIELAGQHLDEFNRVREIIRDFQPGEQIEVKYRRADKMLSAQVRLASRTKILQNWEGEDFANGGISVRTDNFTQIIQHDLPLHPLDMGSPLFDIEGHALGINIARVDRVTTFALPAEVFWKEFQPLIETDRHPPKALKP
jgi:S1-C subfamily serine protease